MKVGVLGAGNVGQFVGAHIISGARKLGDDMKVLFVGRSVLRRTEEAGCLKCTDFQRPGEALHFSLPVPALELSEDPLSLQDCDIVFVCLKCSSATDVGPLRTLRPGATVISLQNGVGNVKRLKELLLDSSSLRIVAGMIPYGVNEIGPGQFHRCTAGSLAFDDTLVAGGGSAQVVGETSCGQRLVHAMRSAGLGVELFEPFVDMPAVQHFKLIVNLSNSLNALVGEPLERCLESRVYRRILAAIWREGLAACAGAGFDFENDPKLAHLRTRGCALDGKPLSRVIRLMTMPVPNWLYIWITRRMKSTDSTYKSSMLVDLEQKRSATEIDEINGKIMELAKDGRGASTPVVAVVAELVRAAAQKRQGSPGMAPEELWDMLLSRAPESRASLAPNDLMGRWSGVRSRL